jgi:hypothetical protein
MRLIRNGRLSSVARDLFPLVLCAALCLVGLAIRAAAPAAPQAATVRWYRGNTHVHTVLCGHADSSPEAVAQWYLDQGYHFLCLSEHNRFIDPATVALPANRREDFLLIPGEEITGTHVHMTGLNIRELVIPTGHPNRTQTIQAYADRTRAAGGTPIINHPNFGWALTHADIRPVKNCYLFELYNGHPSVHNEGDATHLSTEAMWDALLTDGMVIYGVSSDDAHEFQLASRNRSNPGRGWVMVRAAELTPGTITDAIDRGDFYASSGVMLKVVHVDDAEYRVGVDVDATSAETAKPELVPRRLPPGAAAEPGYRIDFIGPGGKVLESANGPAATYRRETKVPYVRAKVTYTWRTHGETLECAAWTQPAFGDGRLKASTR